MITKLNPGLGNKYATDKAVRELRTTKQRVRFLFRLFLLLLLLLVLLRVH